MRIWILLATIALCLGSLTGCKDRSSSDEATAESGSGPVEHIDAKEKAAAAKLTPAKDPINEEIYQFRLKVRQAYNNRAFEELEGMAAELRATKPLFKNGSWKIVQFYGALDCAKDEPESMWQEHDRIHQEWITAKPLSITARVAYADFLTSYAWQARGSEYSDKVTEKGWALFGERLASARKTLEVAQTFPEKDPMSWRVTLTLALGEGWPKPDYDALVKAATEFEPTFWGYDTARAYSLLPRWHGEPGDVEAYAEQAAERTGGLGAEVYARIAMHLRGYYDNIYRETRLSWPKTREGLAQLREKYPESLEILSQSAMLATMGQDRELAKEMFAQLDGRYLPSVWRKPERFVHYRTWAETGEW